MIAAAILSFLPIVRTSAPDVQPGQRRGRAALERRSSSSGNGAAASVSAEQGAAVKQVGRRGGAVYRLHEGKPWPWWVEQGRRRR
jgi:hypothetical protein